MKKVLFAAMVIGEAAFSPLLAGNLLEEIAARDEAADAVVASIRTVDELKAKQSAWRAYWLDALGEMPARTPLNARVASRAEYDGFRLENIIFESQPGVYVTAHLALPMRPRGSVALPVVLMPLGHSDAGILNPRYAAHLAMAARAGFAAFAWDPISQGERRQACDKKFDSTDNCSTEHTRLGARGWLVVGRDAENVIVKAAAQVKANGGKPVPLVAKGWDCIAAAHAYAAEPQLFSEVCFSELPTSWTELVTNLDPTHDSYAIAVWGALKDYDWPDLVPVCGL